MSRVGSLQPTRPFISPCGTGPWVVTLQKQCNFFFESRNGLAGMDGRELTYVRTIKSMEVALMFKFWA